MHILSHYFHMQTAFSCDYCECVVITS